MDVVCQEDSNAVMTHQTCYSSTAGETAHRRWRIPGDQAGLGLGGGSIEVQPRLGHCGRSITGNTTSRRTVQGPMTSVCDRFDRCDRFGKADYVRAHDLQYKEVANDKLSRKANKQPIKSDKLHGCARKVRIHTLN